MNKTKLRWKIYKLLTERGAIRRKRGGYSIAYLYDYILDRYDLEMGVFGDPALALKDLTPSLSSFF